ncbi:hypothetical protein BGZ92_004663 [Podila epicladia]|nr:hypothetical protein BGZ92_004663 [Podila epicladia]
MPFLADKVSLIIEAPVTFKWTDVAGFSASLITFEPPSNVTEESVILHLRLGSRIIFLSSSLISISTITPQFFLYYGSMGASEQMARVRRNKSGPEKHHCQQCDLGLHPHGRVPPRQDQKSR